MFHRGITWLLGVSLIPISFARPQADVQTACITRERLTSSWGIITSPNFPRPYSSNLSCTWVITTSEGSTVSFNFTSFDVTSGGNCNRGRCGCDYVQVRGQNASTPQVQLRTKYCNNNKPPSALTLFTNKVRLHFRTTNQGGGFSLTYTSHDPVVKATTASWKSFIARYDPELTTRSGHISTVKPITTQNSQEEHTTNSKSTNTTLGTPRTHFSARISNDSKNGNKIPGAQATKPSFNPPVSTARAPLDVAVMRSTAGNVSVVLFVEEEEKEEYVNDIVVLGPSLPIVFIFVVVVAGIAWWNYISDRTEYNRIDRYGRFWRYFRRGKHGNDPPESRGVQTSTYSNKKRRGSLKEVRTQNLYTDMMRNWKGQANSTTPYQAHQRRVTRTHSFGGRLTASQENSQRSVARIHSFAGRLTAPQESSRTPMPTRPDSMVARNVDKPVETGQEAGSTSSLVSKPPHVTPSNSRPTSVLLRDTLALLFGTNDSLEGDSKPGSKRVSFAKELSNPTTLQGSDMNPEEVPLLQEDINQGENLAYSVDARPMQIPSIIVEHPGVSNLHATPECPQNANELDLLVPNTTPADETHESLAKEQIFPDLEDFLLNLDKDFSMDDPPYSCAHHVRDILRQSYGAADDAHSLSWEVLTVPDEFLEMMRSPEQRKQFEDVEEVD